MEKKKTESEFLYNILYTIFKKKYMALAVFFVTFTGIIFGTYLTTSLWKATAKVRVQYNPKQQLAMLKSVTTPGTEVPGVNPANDVIQMLTSRELAEKIALKFKRDELWDKRTNNKTESTKEIIRWHIHDVLIGKPIEFLQYLGILTKQPDNYLAMAVDELQEDLEEIELEEDTTIVDVAVWGESPEIATDMSNTLVQLLLGKNLDSSRRTIDVIIKLSQEQLATAEKNLRAVQEDLRKFKEESELVLYDEEATILLQRLDKYDSELKTSENQLASMRIEKSLEHPEVKSIEAKINEYKNTIIPKLKSDLHKLPLKEVELAKLTQELKVRDQLYSTLKNQMLELEALRNSSMGDVGLKVIDPAKVYSYVKPDWPRWVINIPLGLIGSILVSLGFIFFTEYWNTSFKSVKELEGSFPLQVLGSIPKFSFLEKKKLLESLKRRITESKEKKSLARIVQEERFLEPLAGFNHIVDIMMLDIKKSQDKVFLITSQGPGEGKTLLTSILSEIFAIRGKRVLLIEGNLRTPALAKTLGIDGNKGLVDYYVHDLPLKDIIVNINGINVIPAGSSQPDKHIDPFEILSSEKMERLLQDAKGQYDLIFVDSPCLKKFKDVIALSTMSDKVLIIIEANETPKRSIVMAIDKINGAGGQIKGFILNKQINYVPPVIQSFLY